MLTPELASLICKIDLSTPEKVSAFKAWQFDDGTLEGLQKLYEAQQSVHPTNDGLIHADSESTPAVISG
jgi:hypothetical protein